LSESKTQPITKNAAAVTTVIPVNGASIKLVKPKIYITDVKFALIAAKNIFHKSQAKQTEKNNLIEKK